tara:strand:- start:687 stop:1151 length:465 start_codon:yes stop_codon:yes gene_type:complete
MNKIAAVVEDMGPSQKSFYMIKEFNKAASFRDMSICAFYHRPSMPVTKPFFSCRNIAFLSGYDGAAIATGLQEAQTLLKSHNNSDKYLYLWDIEWLTNPVNFSIACDVLLDKRLKIIARSESHAKVINNFCNKAPVGIVDNWNFHELRDIINRG